MSHRAMTSHRQTRTVTWFSSDDENVEKAELVDGGDTDVEMDKIDIEKAEATRKAAIEEERKCLKVKKPKTQMDVKSSKLTSTLKASMLEARQKLKEPHGSRPKDTDMAKPPKKPLTPAGG